MQDRNISELFNNLEFDPFAEDENYSTRSYATEGEDDDFEVVAAKLNARRSDDDPLLAMRAMLNDTPYVRREENHPKPSVKIPDSKAAIEEQFAKSEQKISIAQKRIKSDLRKLRNKIKLYYREMKADEKALSSKIENDALKPAQQDFVDFLLCELAGIRKFKTQFYEDKNSLVMQQSQLNQEYLDFKDIHYHALVVCMVKFLQSYTSFGLNHLSTFSGLQLSFRNYLYDTLKIEPTITADTKQNTEMKFETPLPATPLEHLSSLERLHSILQAIADHLNSCFSCLTYLKRPFCTLFRHNHTIQDDPDSGLDHKHNNDDSKRLGR